MNLALFDFDGTITTKEMFTPFMVYTLSKKHILLGQILIFPDALLYKLGLLHGSKVRQKICYFALKDKSEEVFRAHGNLYAQTIIPKYVRAEAKQRIAWHKSQGDRVVIVSASLDLYLKRWCDDNGLELVCNEVATKDGKLTGRLAGIDCSSAEKSRRVLSTFNLAEYDTIYSYGDTIEDMELLQLADEQYYRYFENA